MKSYKRTLVKYRNSRFRRFIKRYEKYLLILFFVGGFIFDSLTLGRIDRVYDITVLSFYMAALTVTVYLFNLVDDGKWANTFLERFQLYFPLAIQFFFGGLSSAFVVYFSRSVSMTRTVTFFIILVFLLIANEVFKKRISNKYLQFSFYFFVSFTFFTFMIPVILKKISTGIFLISGVVSLGITLALIAFIYRKSPSTRAEVKLPKLLGIIAFIYGIINIFYFTNLIPPVPLALKEGIVAHQVTRENSSYFVSYERDDWYIFWRDHRLKFIHKPGERVFIFTSIFAPTKIKKSVSNRWKWYNENSGRWEVVDNISYDITGGRNAGYRGYTFKDHVKPGLWKVDVITKEGLILGVLDFKIINDTIEKPKRVVKREF